MDNIDGIVDTGKVQLPPEINSHPTKFEIAGAGMWYSRLHAVVPGTDDWGRNWGFDCQGQTVYYHDFALEGENRGRTEGGKPLVNGYGQDTVIENLWVEHSTIGFWVGGADRQEGQDFPAGLTQEQKQSKGLIIRNCRIRNTGADGINLCAGTTNALIENVHCRSNGDDSFAIWSEKDAWVDSDKINEGGCQGNIIRFCTAELTWRANGFGIYGGRNNLIQDCIAKDIMCYHGIMVDTGTFQSSPIAGTLLIERITLLRTSGTYFGQYWPAIGVYHNPGATLTFNDIDIFDCWYGVFRFKNEAYATFNRIRAEKFCQDAGGGDSSIGFIGPFGNGKVTFNYVTQCGWGGKGNSFYANPRQLNPDTYIVGPGCNFDSQGPLNDMCDEN